MRKIFDLEVSKAKELSINMRKVVTPKTNSDYNTLTGKPSINGVELTGDKTTQELGLNSTLEFNSYLEFPSIPNDKDINSFFIDVSNHTIYRWDKEKFKYFIFGSNYQEIEVINGGDAYGNKNN